MLLAAKAVCLVFCILKHLLKIIMHIHSSLRKVDDKFVLVTREYHVF